MAACANHLTVTAVAFCRTCGKPLCEQCKRDVRGVVYCEDCLVAHLQNVMPPPAPAPGIPTIDPATGYVRPPGTPNPTLAAILGVIPGVGAFYNGQYQKGVIHVLMFPALIMLTNQYDVFGVLFPFYFFYMVWDAYKTAKSKITGEEVPDPLGINNLFGMEKEKVDFAEAGQNQSTNGLAGVPIGALVLIGLGVLFLLGDIDQRFMRHIPPMILIAFGVWRAVVALEVKEAK
jgi:hypothetical protein